MTTPTIDRLAREAHIKWLSKSETAIIKGQELTVLPYGYLETAVKEALTTLEAEVRGERDALFQEVNVKKLMEQMEEDAKEYGQYHDIECPQMSEYADWDAECSCETILAMKSFAREYIGKTNEMWVTHISRHRKHCSSYGNKDLTKIKRAILTPQGEAKTESKI